MTLATPALTALRREVAALEARVTRLEHAFGVRSGSHLRLLQGGRR